MNKYSAYEYIKIDLAEQFGQGELNFEDRVKWVDTNRDTFITQKAKEPILATKAYNALLDAEAGVATGFLTSMDATSSGLQIMACLSGCHTTAGNVNLINTGRRENAYRKVAEVIFNKCGTQYTTKEVKKPVMTTMYNSRAQPKQLFGDGTIELETFYDTMWELFPGAMDVLTSIQSYQDSTALEYVWTLPDQHTARVKVMTPVDKKIEVDELNHATFTHRAYINQSTDFDLSLPANIVQSIDGYIVREMYRLATEQKFELLTIHDSFIQSDAA